jgi:hypothetical protein
VIQPPPRPAEHDLVMSLQPVPHPTVRRMSTAPVEPGAQVVPAAPALVPAAVVVQRRQGGSERQRRMSFAQARAALALLGRDDA